MSWDDFKTKVDGTPEQTVALRMAGARSKKDAQSLHYWEGVRDVLAETPDPMTVKEAEAEYQARRKAAAGQSSEGSSDEGVREAAEGEETVANGSEVADESDESSERVSGASDADAVGDEPEDVAEKGVEDDGSSEEDLLDEPEPPSKRKKAPLSKAREVAKRVKSKAELPAEALKPVQVRSLPRDVFMATRRQLEDAGALAGEQMSQTDVVTVALAFFCGMTFPSMEEKHIRAYNALRKSEIGNMSETAKAIRSLAGSVRELRGLVYSGNVATEHLLRRHMGLSLEDTPTDDRSVDIVDGDGYSVFHKVMLEQGAEQMRRDDDERNRRYRSI